MMLALCLFVLSWLLSPTIEDMLMNLDRVDHAYTPVTVRFVNDLSMPHSVCWIPSTSSTDAISQHPCKQARSEGSDGCLCIDISAHAHHDMHTTVESVWIISKSGSEAVLGQINVFGGVHIFVLSRYLNSADTGSCTSGLSPTGAVVHVHSPDDCSSQTGYDVLGPMWKDAARIAASRHNFSLCLCGDYNASSTYTLHLPNPELPNILSGSKCACGNGVRNDALPEGHLGVYTLHNDPRKRPLFNMYMPCSFTVLCAQQFQLAMNCHPQRDRLLKFLGLDERESNSTSTAALASRHFSSVRINMLHSTVESDRLSLKNKLWSTLSSFYGHRVASLIMPESFRWEDLTERQRLYELCNSDASNRNVFIMKDPNAHRQHGIQLASAQNILSGKTFVQGRYQMATKFLSNPFLVRGYKINIRRYLFAVCVRGRLRGYVHDDGKNIYTKQRYREPWNLGSSSKGRFDLDSNPDIEAFSHKSRVSSCSQLTIGPVMRVGFRQRSVSRRSSQQGMYHLPILTTSPSVKLSLHNGYNKDTCVTTTLAMMSSTKFPSRYFLRCTLV